MLRTQRQLGYVVACGVRAVGLCKGLSVHVQSAVMGPEAIEAEVEDWLRLFESEVLSTLSQADVDAYTASIAANLEEPPRTLMQECSPLWSEIVERTYLW